MVPATPADHVRAELVKLITADPIETELRLRQLKEESGVPLGVMKTTLNEIRRDAAGRVTQDKAHQLMSAVLRIDFNDGKHLMFL